MGFQSKVIRQYLNCDIKGYNLTLDNLFQTTCICQCLLREDFFNLRSLRKGALTSDRGFFIVSLYLNIPLDLVFRHESFNLQTHKKLEYDVIHPHTFITLIIFTIRYFHSKGCRISRMRIPQLAEKYSTTLLTI
jgi:hypothetical protein